MFILKIFLYTIGIILAIPVALCFLVYCMFKKGWKMLGFICQRRYRELKRLCMHGSAAELQAFLEANPGAREYVVYTRQGLAARIMTFFFRLPSPLAVAGRANNIAVIPVLLAHGASAEVRSVSEKQTPAEEAIGNPERMRALCEGKTWWLEGQEGNDDMLEAAIKARNLRGIIWHTLRGARLTRREQLYTPGILRLPPRLMEFICRFGISEEQAADFHSSLKQIPLHKQMRLGKAFGNMLRAMEKSLQPLPEIGEDAISSLLFTSGLMRRKQMLEMLNHLFSSEQQLSLLRHFLNSPIEASELEMVEDTVDLLLCSILKR